MKYYTVVDIFSGVGGFTQGFKKAKYKDYRFKVVAALDIWNNATQAYSINHPKVIAINGDIRNTETKEKLVTAVGNHVDVLIGGPPCEAFSLAGKRDPNDPRAKLFYDYVDVVRRLQPYMFVMENVKGILSMITLRQDISEQEKKDALNDLNELLELKSVGKKRRAAPQYVIRNNKFKDIEERKKIMRIRKQITTVPVAIGQAFSNINSGYKVSKPRLLNAADYGVPQLRMRVFFIGGKKDQRIDITFPEPTHSKESKINIDGRKLERWKTVKDAIGSLPPLSNRREDETYKGAFSSIFMSRNRRMSWDKPSYTILASARHILLHPSSPKMVKVERDKRVFEGEGEPRRLSIRECAKIQSFPDDYEFIGKTIDKYTLIGDAVPPLLAQRIAESVLKSLVNAKIKPSISE